MLVFKTPNKLGVGIIVGRGELWGGGGEDGGKGAGVGVIFFCRRYISP